MTTMYYTVDGEITGESSGGTRSDYLTDALGSVTAKVDQSSVVASSARYKPYGDVLTQTRYRFGWIGSMGYRTTNGSIYVRRRTFDLGAGCWSSLDILWPTESAYAYNPSDARSSNYQEIFDDYYFYGHYYDVILSYSYHKIRESEKEGDCSLEWWELSSEDYAGCPKNTWCQQYGKASSATFDPWDSRPKPCSGNGAVTLPDRPHIGADIGSHNTWERELCIRVIHRKAPGCECEFDNSERRAYQYLLIVNGQPRQRKFHHDNDAPFFKNHPFPGGGGNSSIK